MLLLTADFKVPSTIVSYRAPAHDKHSKSSYYCVTAGIPPHLDWELESKDLGHLSTLR